MKERKRVDADNLLLAYFSDELDMERRQFVENWRAQSKENAKLFEETKYAWEASAVLSQMEKFNSFEAINKVNKQLEEKKRKPRLFKLQRVAAVLLIPLCVYTAHLAYKNKQLQTGVQVQQTATQTVTSSPGAISKVHLPDGTKVCLNSNSELRFPLAFAGKTREVDLKGEAYFEVSRNEQQAFRVNAAELNVDVLGTSFNVSQWTDNQQLEVVLVEGKVKLSADNENEGEQALGKLTPGQRAIYNVEKQEAYFEYTDVEKYVAWRDGRLVFKNDKMSDVVRRLNRWFNVDIVVTNPEINSYVYTAVFTTESITQVLDLIKISAPIKYNITEIKEKPDGTRPKPKIIISKDNKCVKSGN